MCREPRPDRDSLYRRSRALHVRYGEARGRAQGGRAQACGRQELVHDILEVEVGRLELVHDKLEQELVHDTLEVGSKVLESMLVEALESIVA